MLLLLRNTTVGNATAAGSIASLALSIVNGNAAVTTNAVASGVIHSIQLTAPAGNASAGTNGAASGNISSLVLGVVSGNASATSGSIDVTATGNIHSSILVAPLGYAYVGGLVTLAEDRMVVVNKRLSIIKIRNR